MAVGVTHKNMEVFWNQEYPFLSYLLRGQIKATQTEWAKQGTSWNQTKICYMLPADISKICGERNNFCSIKVSLNTLQVWVVLFLIFNLLGEDDLKYLIPIWNYSKSALEMVFLFGRKSSENTSQIHFVVCLMCFLF